MKSIADNVVKSDHVFSPQRTTMNTEPGLLRAAVTAPAFSSRLLVPLDARMSMSSTTNPI